MSALRMTLEGGQDGPLVRVLRTRHVEIMAEWARTARALAAWFEPDAGPDLLDWIEELVQSELARGRIDGEPVTEAHRRVLARCEGDIALAELVTDLGRLRDCVLNARTAAIGGEARGGDGAGELRTLDHAIDAAIAATVERCVALRERTLRGLEQLSEIALSARDRETVDREVLDVILDSHPGLDVGVLLSEENGMLRVRAAVGLPGQAGGRGDVALGHGLLGRVAVERRPIAVAGAALVELEPALARPDIMAGYAVPLQLGGDLVGVIYVGTRDPLGLPPPERHLVDALAERAACALVHHQLVAERELGLAERDAFFTVAPAGVALIDDRLRFAKLNGALAAMWGARAEDLVGRPVADVLPPGHDRLLRLLRRVLERGEVVRELPLRQDLATGETRWLLATCFPVRKGAGAPRAIAAIVIDITDRKRIEDELRERELQFRTLADNIPQLAWMADADGALFWINQRWSEYTGTTLGEVVGSRWKRTVHPAHVDRVVETLERSFALGEAWEDTFPMRGRDGQFRWFLSRAQPIRDQRERVQRWFGTCTDVSEQWLLDEATTHLSESIEPAVTFPKIARLAIPVLADLCVFDLVEGDALRRIAWAHVDPELERAWAQRVFALVPDLHDETHPVARAIAMGTPVFVPAIGPVDHHLLAIGSLTSAIVVPMTLGERRLGALTFAYSETSSRHHTVAQRHTAQELARRAAIAVDHARNYQEARRAIHTRERVLAVVSHDLRTPLGTIELAMAALRANVDDPGLVKHLDVVQRATRRMDRLIGDLLDMASLQAGRLAVRLVPVRMNELLDEAIEAQVRAAHDKGLALVRDSTLTDQVVRCDPQRMLQVLGNLIGNAIKFSRSGDRIVVCGRETPDYVTIEVSDTGPGIQPEDLRHVFDPYWSAADAAERGTGLGLYISRGIVEAHGGMIGVDSVPGRGSTFWIRLPNR
jgi:PAS domain S-box-containing protein